GVGLLAERLAGQEASPFTTLLRRKLVGARLVSLGLVGRATLLGLATKEGPFTLLVAPEGPEGAIRLCDAEGKVHVGRGRAQPANGAPEPIAWAPLAARGEALR